VPDAPQPPAVTDDEPVAATSVERSDETGTPETGADAPEPIGDLVERQQQPAAEQASVPAEPYSGEETVLWFGRRPASPASVDAPSDDAAGEMEVASTGRRGWVSPEEGASGLPGGQELDEALAGLDTQGGVAVPTATQPADSTAGRPPARPSALTASPDAPTSLTGEMRGPASRAYRRLRRIFPT
jgi:hypothetical protein